MSETATKTPANGKADSPQPTGLSLINRMPDLKTFEPASIDIANEYWSPEEPGEKRRLLFWEVKPCQCLDYQTNEMIELDCVIFAQKIGDNVKSIRNGSRLLLAVFEHGNIERGTPVEVTYLGKKKAKRSGNMCDTWSVVPLQPKGE